MQTTYLKGSLSHDMGGMQFYSLWNTTDGLSFNSMMVSYEVVVDASFDWVKGGKLPSPRTSLFSLLCGVCSCTCLALPRSVDDSLRSNCQPPV